LKNFRIRMQVVREWMSMYGERGGDFNYNT
jgi:hypothetical protein